MTVGTDLRVELVTPLGAIANLETDAVTAPGELGEFEIFAGHVPFLTQLHAGVLTLGETRTKQHFAVGPGFLEVTADGLIRILVERAVASDEVDKALAKDELKDAEPKLDAWKGDLGAEYKTLKAAHDWAVAQIEAAGR